MRRALATRASSSLVGAGVQAGRTLHTLVELGDVEHEGAARRLARAHLPDELEAVGDQHRPILGRVLTQRFRVRVDRLDFKDVGRDPPQQLLTHRLVVAHEQRLGCRQDP